MFDHRKRMERRNAANRVNLGSCCPDLHRRRLEIEERLHRLRVQMEIWELEEELDRVNYAQLKHVQKQCEREEVQGNG